MVGANTEGPLAPDRCDKHGEKCLGGLLAVEDQKGYAAKQCNSSEDRRQWEGVGFFGGYMDGAEIDHALLGLVSDALIRKSYNSQGNEHDRY